MTKRDRHIRTLKAFGLSPRQVAEAVSRHGLSIFTDEAIALLRENILTSEVMRRTINQQNRRIGA